jgi:hypothetical protein
MYWAYCVTQDTAFYDAALETANTLLQLQQSNGDIPPYIKQTGKVDFDLMERIEPGIGAVWQYGSMLEGLSISQTIGYPSDVSLWVLSKACIVNKAVYDAANNLVSITLTADPNEKIRVLFPKALNPNVEVNGKGIEYTEVKALAELQKEYADIEMM